MKSLMGLPDGYNNVSDLKIVEGTNFLYGGLNLVYGVDGTGKSWQIAKCFTSEAVYIDTDGSNGSAFKEHCEQHQVHYINNDTVETMEISGTQNPTIIMKVLGLIELIKTNNTEQSIFIVDSLSSINEGGNINNSEDISPIMYTMNNFAEKFNIAIILIDHATEGKDYQDGFKLEGNAGAKRRSTVTVNRYLPHSKPYPELGGTFVCERARGNQDGLSKGSTVVIHSVTIKDAKEWIICKFPELLKGKTITSSDFTKATKHNKDLWIREYRDSIFELSVDKRTTYLTLKG
jgi:hypothetical protein